MCTLDTHTEMSKKLNVLVTVKRLMTPDIQRDYRTLNSVFFALHVTINNFYISIQLKQKTEKMFDYYFFFCMHCIFMYNIVAASGEF